MNTAKIIETKRREQENRRLLLTMNPYLKDNSGIYVFVRKDENLKYAYVGQAKHVLTRLAQHLAGYEQHIDLSLKKHGLFSIHNPHGWYVTATYFSESELDAQEQAFIKQYADMGYQLRNKTSGSQGKGKVGIAPNKPSKGYYDGKKQGRRDIIVELNSVVKYLQITPKNDGKLASRMEQKFWAILGESSYGKDK